MIVKNTFYSSSRFIGYGHLHEEKKKTRSVVVVAVVAVADIVVAVVDRLMCD